PNGSVINAASLFLYMLTHSGLPVFANLYMCEPFSESTVTQFPTCLQPLGGMIFETSPGWYFASSDSIRLNVGNVVNSNDQIYIAVGNTFTQSYSTFASSEYANPALRPYLKVDFTLP